MKKNKVVDNVDLVTGEIIEPGEFGKMKIIESKRPDGSTRVRFDFSLCPTMTEQHTAHTTDLNYLISKYQPDELAAYLIARGSYRQEILGHDFSVEPSRQEAFNSVYGLKQIFNELPDKVRFHFDSPTQFFKFIDNPANAEKMIELGLMTKKEVSQATASLATSSDRAPSAVPGSPSSSSSSSGTPAPEPGADKR